MAPSRNASPAKGWKRPKPRVVTKLQSSPRLSLPLPSGAPRIITSAISRSMAAIAMLALPSFKNRKRLSSRHPLAFDPLFVEPHGDQDHDHGGKAGERARQPDDQPAIMLVIERGHIQ